MLPQIFRLWFRFSSWNLWKCWRILRENCYLFLCFSSDVLCRNVPLCRLNVFISKFLLGNCLDWKISSICKFGFCANNTVRKKITLLQQCSSIFFGFFLKKWSTFFLHYVMCIINRWTRSLRCLIKVTNMFTNIFLKLSFHIWQL